MKLKDYLASKSITAAEFGRRIKVSQAAVTRYAAGDRIPEPDIMRRIARITGGIVSPNDFYGPAPPNRRRGSRPRTKAEQGRRENRRAIAEANDELTRNGLWSKGLDLLDKEPQGLRPAKPNRAAIEAWNEWIEENGIPFAGLRPW
jgi:transcriptional regulator with XRE-family HTH domain